MAARLALSPAHRSEGGPALTWRPRPRSPGRPPRPAPGSPAGCAGAGGRRCTPPRPPSPRPSPAAGPGRRSPLRTQPGAAGHPGPPPSAAPLCAPFALPPPFPAPDLGHRVGGTGSGARSWEDGVQTGHPLLLPQMRSEASPPHPTPPPTQPLEIGLWGPVRGI